MSYNIKIGEKLKNKQIKKGPGYFDLQVETPTQRQVDGTAA